MRKAEKERIIHVYCRNRILYAELEEILGPLDMTLSFFMEETDIQKQLWDCRVLILDGPAADASLLAAWRKEEIRPTLIVLRTDTDPSVLYFREQGVSACLNLKNTTPVMLKHLAADYVREWGHKQVHV